MLSIYGQEKPLQILLHAYKSGDVPHSVLFTGARGVGKFTTAMWFASLLLCTEPAEGASPCGHCPACKKMAGNNHPDVRIITPDKKTLNIKIEQVRALQKEAYYLSYEGSWKIFIIDDAHRLLDAAANAFLKILEEPPSKMITILVTDNLHALLPTIVSRCQIVRFAPISDDRLVLILIDKGIPEDRSRIIAQIARGSAGRAIGLAERESLWEGRRRMLDLLACLGTASPQTVLGKIERFPPGLEEAELALDVTLCWLRDLLLLKEQVTGEPLINTDCRKELSLQESSLTYWQIENSISVAREATHQLAHQITPSLVMQRLFIQMNRIQSLNYDFTT